MYGIFIYIYLILMLNVGKNTKHSDVFLICFNFVEVCPSPSRVKGFPSSAGKCQHQQVVECGLVCKMGSMWDVCIENGHGNPKEASKKPPKTWPLVRFFMMERKLEGEISKWPPMWDLVFTLTPNVDHVIRDFTCRNFEIWSAWL